MPLPELVDSLSIGSHPNSKTSDSKFPDPPHAVMTLRTFSVRCATSLFPHWPYGCAFDLRPNTSFTPSYFTPRGTVKRSVSIIAGDQSALLPRPPTNGVSNLSGLNMLTFSAMFFILSVPFTVRLWLPATTASSVGEWGQRALGASLESNAAAAL